jgi:hypothetical protein
VTAPAAPAPRAVGAVLLTAALIAVVLAVIPFLQTLAAIGPAAIAIDSGYVGQILLVRAPFLLTVPLAVGVVVLASFAGVAPIRGELRMGQVIRRGVVTGVVALVVAGIVATLVSMLALFLTPSSGGLLPLGSLTAYVVRVGLLDAPVQFGGQLTTLLAVPLGAILLWGWLRRERPEAPGAPIPREV